MGKESASARFGHGQRRLLRAELTHDDGFELLALRGEDKFSQARP